ncbi:hypothetical protein N7495_009617 [Penicillium taxi]|uniref:uncharacterized protein n=1 Tax=Penicillium taxi TaxID=168475 RepID=UPI00254590D1|nr:uncharacterized protein N7495_009617 [Penicillium taxi]KAJ5885107.1 hypothetical protein N7495_009617 [Penicillium taxi]
MSQVPETTSTPASAGASASGAEKKARSGDGASTSTPKLRSCTVCRSRKVRCDKLSPCTNCRRAGIPCVIPSSDRPPRWARRLQRPVTGDVMERLHHLENLVKELNGQLEQANSVKSPTALSSQPPRSSSQDQSSKHRLVDSQSPDVQSQFGRLVIKESNQSRYVGTGFWSKVNDEIDQLKMSTREKLVEDSTSSEEETSMSSQNTPSTLELERSPSERHAFLFRHNLHSSTSDLREYHPLPSQIPFLLDVFAANVNAYAQVIHLPTVTKMIRDLRGDMTRLTPANEALVFSIYYATVTSMEEDDININFGTTKAELNLKYRLGLEHALAKADFLNMPNLVLVQALTIFLFLVRRHDSPTFVWMMTGIVIRMGLALGLHRDGSNFAHLTPFEIEMRRRAWACLVLIDTRASEDQGTEFTIASGSYDTKIPSNINNADINPETKDMLPSRDGLTDMTLCRVFLEICNVSKRMLSQTSKALSLEEQGQLVNEIYERLETEYIRYSAGSESSIEYWVVVTSGRIVMAKMTLLAYLPLLFSSPKEHLAAEIRTKLLIAAIEVAEYNHALNSEQSCRQWRWIFQTYTHWYSIVYILIEISRRAWSPIVERAWIALHSIWLIPPQSHVNKNLRIWFPLRKLMAQAKRHREAELARLRGDISAQAQLEEQDRKIPLPTSPGPFPAGSDSARLFLQRWRELVQVEQRDMGINIDSANLNLEYGGSIDQNLSKLTFATLDSGLKYDFPVQHGQNVDSTLGLDNRLFDSNVVPWLMNEEEFGNLDVELDVNMDLDGNIDWYNWVESAKGMELDPSRQ